jgi:uncharacterized membrane protein
MTGISDRSDDWIDDVRSRRIAERGPELLPVLLAAGVGAAAMYLFDPARGRRRRRILGDKVRHAAHVAADTAATTSRDLANHARGLAAATQRPFTPAQADDAVIHDRVRAELGRIVSHPGAIEVAVDQGRVALNGPVLTDEADALVECVSKVRGVADVADNLVRHDSAGSVPGLQGTPRVPARRFELQQENWTPAARLLVGLAGGYLIARASRPQNRESLLNAVIGLAGAGLLTRATTNLPFDRLVGIGAGRRAITVRDSINIGAPVDEVFARLGAWEQWPQWMSHVRDVRVGARSPDGSQRTHWVVDGPAGKSVSWDAITTRFIPNELIAWKTVDGSVIQHAGRIRLVPTDQGSTRVDIQMSYNPVLGAAGHAIALLFRSDPQRQLNDDLVRLKTTIETGVPPRDAARVVDYGTVTDRDGAPSSGVESRATP